MGQLKDWVKQDWVRIGTDGRSRVSAALQKTRRTQIDVYLEVKLSL